MKRTFLLMGLFFTIAFQSSFAAQKEYSGYLNSGDGYCYIKFEKQNDYLYQIIYNTSAFSLKGVNIELKNGVFTELDEAFSRDGDHYEQLFFDIPVLPRTYRFKIKSIGKGRFFIEKKTSIFGQVSFRSTDICITKY